MNRTQQHIVRTVMAAHFIAAFAALGMPPFFTIILSQDLHSDAAYLAGWFYIVPTLFAALSSPWWGKLADRFDKRALLLRAQIGLAGSFFLAGFANSVAMFFVGLALQGLLGGTFAAGNAYLASAVKGTALSRSLTLMQASARAALIIAPIALGLFMTVSSPIELYRYLALLPLLAALLVWRLPAWDAERGESAEDTLPGIGREPVTPLQIYALQFVFVLATVITFPYFVSFAQHRFPELTAGTAGLLFALPHAVYLALASPMQTRLGQKPLTAFAFAFLGLAVTYAGQAHAQTVWALALWRAGMGATMTLGFVALHAQVSGLVRAGNAGRTFGWLESASKWGAVCAGLLAGAGVHLFDAAAPFLIGACVIAMVAAYVCARRFFWDRAFAQD